MINNLYDMAVTEKDHATASMLKWFIDEQVEEEESATTIIDSLKLVSGDKMGVFMLDKELAEFWLTDSAAHIHDWVRGMNPGPMAWFTTSGGKRSR